MCPSGWLSSTLPIAVALVAVHAVVHIPLHATMVLVRLRLRMAIRALENRVVIRIRMARRAHSIGIAMVDRELCVLRVIKRRVLPVRRVVTVLACCREELRLGRVPRIRRVVVIRLVTANTGRRERLVIIVDVAVQADSWRHGVRSGQRELRLIVVERGVGPRDRVVTKLARRWEAGVRHRTRRVVEIVLVTCDAKRAVQVVVVVDVAVRTRARRHGVRTR